MQPIQYNRVYDFTGYQTSSPSIPLPGNQVDAELNAIEATTDAIRANLAIIQRDDTLLGNNTVHPDAFTVASQALIAGSAGWQPRGAWLTGTAYAVKDFFGLKGALSDKPLYRPTFYAIIGVSTIAGVALNLFHVDPIRALFIAAIINGLVAAPLMVLIALLGSDPKIMGKRRSGRMSTTLTWIATAVMAVGAATFVVQLLFA